MNRWTTLLLAVTCAMAVSTVYFAQPLLESIASDLDVAQQQIGWVVGATQAGYALGLILIVPLGDLVERKRLLLGQLLVAALALIGVGLAQQWLVLLAALACALGLDGGMCAGDGDQCTGVGVLVMGATR